MTTTLHKPKLKSRVAIKLTKSKPKVTKARKPARAVPKAVADRKKVTGRKLKKSITALPKGKIKPALKPKNEKAGPLKGLKNKQKKVIYKKPEPTKAIQKRLR